MAVWRLALHPDGPLLCGISLNYRDGKPVPGGLYRSRDGGATWSTVLAGRDCWDVTIDPARPDTVYAGTFVDGVLRSDDAGKSWKRLTGLPFVAPHRVTISPENPGTIYVTTFGGGAWKGRIIRGGGR